MTIDGTKVWAQRMSFRRLVWLFPLAYVLHVLEELPHFTNWARQYANASFTMRDYLTIHLTGIVASVMAPLLIRYFPNRVVIFIFFKLRLSTSRLLQHHLSRKRNGDLWRVFTWSADSDHDLSAGFLSAYPAGGARTFDD